MSVLSSAIRSSFLSLPSLTPPSVPPYVMAWTLMSVISYVFVNMPSAVEFSSLSPFSPPDPELAAHVFPSLFSIARMHCCHMPQCTSFLMKDWVRLTLRLMSHGYTGEANFNRSIMFKCRVRFSSYILASSTFASKCHNPRSSSRTLPRRYTLGVHPV